MTINHPRCTCGHFVILLLFFLSSTTPSAAQNDIFGGTLFTLSNTATAPDGAWSWFEDERAIVDTNYAGGPLLMVSSVSAGSGAGEVGDVDLLYRNLSTGVQGEFEFSNQLERDDHNSAALHILPDGRYLASYSGHNLDQITRWRVSTNPHDPTSWGPEETLSNGANTTYNNVYYLPEDDGGAGRLYNFTRHLNFDPNVQTWNSTTEDWVNRGKLLTEGGGGDRPYLRYATDGKKIHFIATERHPRDFNNSIYHGYVQDGQLFDTNGNVLDANIFNSSGVSPSSLTQIFAGGSVVDGSTMTRSWTISMEVDNTGNPVAIFSARADDPTPNDGLAGFDDHRFFYARHDGVDWQVNEMAKAGSALYPRESDYTGLVSIDPHNPNVVYMSSEVDPITGNATTTGMYELYKGVTSDFGGTWNWTPITANSTMDNLRPLVPKWNGENTAVVWMRGNYTTFEDWDTEVVGIDFAATDPKSQLWKGTAGTTWDNGTTGNWDSGGGTSVAFNDGDEIAFDDTASSFTVNVVGNVAPNGMAFNNANNAYTFTGGGIGGSGKVRLIGGGTTTLANGNNTYTGDTLIAKGTLALSGTATLSSTPHINIHSGATFDVTVASGGSYTLVGQTVTIDGNLNGNVNATSGSTVHVNSSNSMNGNLVANASLVDGLGKITGNLNAEAGAIIQVGGDGFTVVGAPAEAVQYIDANVTSNTTLADGTPMVAGTHYQLEDRSADDKWAVRTIFANGGNIITADDDGNEDAPTLRVTVTGLTPGAEYDTYAYFWDSTDAARVAMGQSDRWHWSGLANITGETDGDGHLVGRWASDFDPADAATQIPMTELTHDADPDNPGPITTDSNPSPPSAGGGSGFENGGYFTQTAKVQEGDRYMLEAGLGNTFADQNGEIFIYIDDTTGNNTNRTWFDGVGVRLIDGPTNVDTQYNLLTIDGDATLNTGSTLELDIYATNALDRLVVGGTLNAGGTLAVTLLDGAPSPQLGAEFQVLEFQSATGSFDGFVLPGLDNGLAWNTAALLIDGTLSVGLPGDYNGDGTVNAADYTVWRDSVGGATLSNRDPLLQGAVGTADYLVWKTNFGNSIPGSLQLPNASQATVPEPAAICLLATAALLYSAVGKRRRFIP